MSDFFDDEKLVEEEKTEPADNRKIPKKKKLLPKVIAGILCVAVLIGGTVAVIKLIPEKEENDSAPEFKTVEVLSLKSEDVSKVSVTNENGKFVFLSETSKNGDSDTETTNWYLEGVDKELQDSSSVSSVVSSLENISAIRKITEKSADNCGLSSPLISAEITKKDNTTVGVCLGDESPDNSGTYLKLSDSDDIYLIEGNLKATLIFDKLSFASTDSMPKVEADGLDDYFTSGNLTKFDSLTVSGKSYPTPLIFTMNTDKSFSDYIPYKITSPQEHYADKLDDIIAIFQNGVSVDGAYSYDTSAAEISKFGLDTPDLVVSMKIKSKDYTNKFKLQSDGNYAAISNDGKLIYKVSPATVSSIADGDATKYYSSIICLFSIDKLKSLTIKAENKTYDFGIKAIDNEDSEDKYEITLDGKKLDCSSFQNLYQYILTFGCYDFTTGETDKNDAVTLIYNFKDDAPVTVSFEKSSDTKYQYSINGKPIGKIQSSKIDKLVKYTKKYVSGEKITELN